MRIKIARANGAVTETRRSSSAGFGAMQSTSVASPLLLCVADKVLHDRTKTKQRLYGAKRAFNAEQVRALRRLHNSNSVTAEDLALITGIETLSMERVLNGTNYAKVL